METWDVYNFKREKINKTIQRGDVLNDDEYHLVVNAWIQNSKGEFLITKRSANKSHPLMWECTGGSAISGETSLDAACREIKEELGISINKDSAVFIGTKLRYYPGCPDILDVWLFKDDTNIKDVVIQQEEVADVMWASSDKIIKLKNNNKFEANDFFEEIIMKNNKESVYYIGFNANNAICNELFFNGSITLYPTKEKGNIFYSKSLIEDTKSDFFMNKYREYIYKSAKLIQSEDNNARFICFNEKIKELCYDMKDINIVKEDKKEINSILNNKFATRELVEELVPILDYKFVTSENLEYKDLIKLVKNDSIVIQAATGSGGSNTYFINSQNDILECVDLYCEKYCVSPYLFHIPINITMIIGEYDIISLPISVQLILITNNKFKYVGGDYIYSQGLDKDIINKTEDYSFKIAKLVQEKGYRGVLGIDFIIDEQKDVYFMEINPRFQASSFLISMYLEKYCNTNIAKLHYDAITMKKIKDPHLRFIDSSFLNCNAVQHFNKFDDYKIVDKGYFEQNKSSVYRKVFNYSVYNKENFESINKKRKHVDIKCQK